MEVEAHAVAHALGVVLDGARFRIDAHDRGLVVARHRDVLRVADIEIQLAVGPHRQVLPEVPGLVGGVEVVDHDTPFARIVEPGLDVVVAGDAVAFGHIQRALVEDDAVGRLLALEDGLDLALAGVVDDGIHVRQVAVADEHRALVAQRQGARFGDAVDPDLDLESFRHAQLVDRQFAGRAAGQVRGEGVQGGFFLLRRHALFPGRRGRRLLRGNMCAETQHRCQAGEPESAFHVFPPFARVSDMATPFF